MSRPLCSRKGPAAAAAAQRWVPVCWHSCCALPRVDVLCQAPELAQLGEEYGEKAVVDAVRQVLAPHITWNRETYDRVYEIAKNHFAANEILTLAQFRYLIMRIKS